jgi:hypothetical protein
MLRIEPLSLSPLGGLYPRYKVLPRGFLLWKLISMRRHCVCEESYLTHEIVLWHHGVSPDSLKVDLLMFVFSMLLWFALLKYHQWVYLLWDQLPWSNIILIQ